MSKTQSPPKPDLIMQYMFGHAPTQALKAGVDLELFTHIARGKTRLGDLAQAAGASERGLKLLVGALCAMKLLTRNDDELALTPVSEMYLVKDGRAYLGGLTSQLDDSWEAWRLLPEAVRKGGTAHHALEQDRAGFFVPWVDSLFNLNFPASQAVAQKFVENARTVLDIGAGSGVWSLAMAKAQPEARITVVDFPEVADQVTRKIAERMGVHERYSFKTGCFHQVDFGTEEFDLAYLGHVLHSEGAALNKTLLEKIHRALKPGGALVVAEMIPDEDRSENMLGNLFGLNMLVHTHHGEVYTQSELEQMARQAGFQRYEWFPAPAPFPLLIAYR